MTEIGETLRERRMALKIDVHEVEEATKIRAKYLRALENEEYALLPGHAYIKSFLRTYADYLGLDSRELVDAYRARGEPVEEELAAFASSPENVSRRKWYLLAVVVVVILLLLFVLGLLGGGGGQS
jgi:cytoskeleton protein RodZ